MFETHLFNELASKEGYKEIVHLLLKYGADFNFLDKEGFSAFHLGK
jgi:ankyrin repeat protein